MKGEIHMKRKLSALVIAAMVMCLGTTPALAANTYFNTGAITNYTASKVFKALVGAPNTKATTNANWFIKVNSISFTTSTSGTLGMAFTPMVKNGTSYAEAGAETIWAKSSFSSAKYAGWKGNGAANVTYYLGARLDTLLNSGSGTSNGYWNAN